MTSKDVVITEYHSVSNTAHLHPLILTGQILQPSSVLGNARLRLTHLSLHPVVTLLTVSQSSIVILEISNQ